MLSQSHIRGLLQSLDFSEGTGTTLNDKSGNNNHATIVGGTWTADRFGRANRAILLDGVDDYIDLGLANYQGDLSALLSVKILNQLQSRVIFSKGTSSYDIVYLLQHYYATEMINFRRLSNGTSVFNRYVSPPGTESITNQFNIFAVGIKTLEATSVTNRGIEITNYVQSATIDIGIFPIMIGKHNTSNAMNNNIIVDRIMLFNRFLSGHELSKLANRLKIGDLDK